MHPGEVFLYYSKSTRAPKVLESTRYRILGFHDCRRSRLSWVANYALLLFVFCSSLYSFLVPPRQGIILEFVEKIPSVKSILEEELFPIMTSVDVYL